MNKDDIDQIRIEIECGGESALSMMLHRDGTVGRSGNGSLPRDGIAVLGVIDNQAFNILLDSLDERVFQHTGGYELKNIIGTPVMYGIAFLQKDNPLATFEFRMGLDNQDAGGLVAYFDGFIQHAVALTNEWHQKALAQKQKEESQQETLILKVENRKLKVIGYIY